MPTTISPASKVGEQTIAGDPVLEQYAKQLRRELELVERKLRGEGGGPE